MKILLQGGKFDGERLEINLHLKQIKSSAKAAKSFRIMGLPVFFHFESDRAGEALSYIMTTRKSEGLNIYRFAGYQQVLNLN